MYVLDSLSSLGNQYAHKVVSAGGRARVLQVMQRGQIVYRCCACWVDGIPDPLQTVFASFRCIVGGIAAGTSDLECRLKGLLRQLLDSRQERWDAARAEVAVMLRELAQYFSGTCKV